MPDEPVVSNTPPNNGHDWRERMDRFERGLEHLLENQGEHQARLDAIGHHLERIGNVQDQLRQGTLDLMRYQVLFADETRSAFSKLAEAQTHTEAKVARLAVTVTEIGDKLNGLIDVVDGLVERRQPPR